MEESMKCSLFEIEDANISIQMDLKTYIVGKYPFLSDSYINELVINTSGCKTTDELRRRSEFTVYREVVKHVKSEIEKLCIINQDLIRVKCEGYEEMTNANTIKIIKLTQYL